MNWLDSFGRQRSFRTSYSLSGVIAQGGLVIVCPLCMKHFGVKETDLLPGFKNGSPGLTGGALFKDNTKALTW